MNFMSALEVAASGLRANRQRMNITSSNLANANSTKMADGTGPYRRRDAVLTAKELDRPFGQVFRDKYQEQARGVEVTEVVVDPRPPRTVYDPTHPDADAQGIVKMPNVNMVEEMVDMITASRAYEAGVTSIQMIKSMAARAMSIGR